MTSYKHNWAESVLPVTDSAPALRPRLFYRDGQVMRAERGDGEAFRSELFWDYVALRSQFRTQFSHPEDQFNKTTDTMISRKLTGFLASGKWPVRARELLVIVGNGLVETGDDEATLQPNLIDPDRILIGTLGGIACGPYHRADPAEVGQIWQAEMLVTEEEAAIAHLDPPQTNASGALVVLEEAAICSQSGAIQEAMNIACAPVAEQTLHFYRGKAV